MLSYIYHFLFGDVIPKGIMLECFGSEDSGKSTFMQSFSNYLIKQGEFNKLIYFISEFKFDEVRFNLIKTMQGVNADCVELVYENEMDLIYKKIQEESLKQENILFVIDSIANVKSSQEDGGYSGAKDVSLLTQYLNHLSKLLYQTKSNLFFVNQARDNLQGRGFRTPKGRMLKHLCSIRIKISKKKNIEIANELGKTESGIVVEFYTHKNQLFLPRLKFYGFIDNSTGLDFIYSLFFQLQELKILAKSGSWTYFKDDAGNTVKFQGLEGFKKVIQQNEDLIIKFEQEILKKLASVDLLSKIKLSNVINIELTEREKQLKDKLQNAKN